MAPRIQPQWPVLAEFPTHSLTLTSPILGVGSDDSDDSDDTSATYPPDKHTDVCPFAHCINAARHCMCQGIRASR